MRASVLGRRHHQAMRQAFRRFGAASTPVPEVPDEPRSGLSVLSIAMPSFFTARTLGR